MLHANIIDAIQRKRQELQLSGQLIPYDRLIDYYTRFREKFGPDRLRSLDGKLLLTTMHDMSASPGAGMVYWLEFKNDEEFPTMAFGSIRGGSSLKYGLWRRKEDGVWVTGKSTSSLIEISAAEAVEIARRQRDQLLKGVELLAALPDGAGQEDYQRLQDEMNSIAPEVTDTAWGHKYFHLHFPEKLDDYHVEYLQKFHLIKLLQPTPERYGRFLSAPSFVAIAAELDMPMNHLTKILNELHGETHLYWRIGTRLGGEQSIWEMMHDKSVIAIGWDKLGDLSHLAIDQQSKNALRELLVPHYPNNAGGVITRKTQEIFDFVTKIKKNDIVLAADGNRILAIGRVLGPYFYVPDDPAPHRHAVEWLSIESWTMPESEGLQTSVRELYKYGINLIETERRIIERPGKPLNGGVQTSSGIPEQIQSVLERKKQVILYGPPGTGKTYWARLAAQELAARSRYGQLAGSLEPEQQQALFTGNDHDNAGAVWMCTFHPGYGYEDFLEGYRPHAEGEQLLFELRDGIFKRLCLRAESDPSHDYFLIIDEINRGDVPRIFGELLTLLEKDKRGQSVLLPLSGTPFAVPPNVYIIATMNTADRSIALLDTALRRRFGFIELMPDTTLLKDRVVANSFPLDGWLEALNKRIVANIGRDARNLQVGHAYFLDGGQPVANLEAFARVLRDDVIPLLQEYCYEDYATLARLLGETLVDEANQRIRFELFRADRSSELVEALLVTEPDLAAAQAVIISAAEAQELEKEAEEVFAESES